MQRARSALPLQFLPRPVRDRSRYYENFLLQNPTTRASRKDERMAPLRRPYRVIYLGPPEARRSEQRQRWCFQNADSPLLRDGIHFSYNTTLLPFFHLQVPRPLLLSRFQTRRSDFLRLDGTGASAQFWVKLCCQSDARQQRKLHPTVAKEIL